MILKRHQDLESYRSDLEANRSELLALYEDLLINVTGFFRDPEAFRALENKILPRLLHERKSGAPVRVWAPGCSTGEEVYSIAMCLVESIPASSASIPIQIFGTDISERSISIARAATYPEARIAKLSPERQARFFKRLENNYQIVKPIREMCVFARHNLLADPPFSRLDLISCRNVLIYLDSDSQGKAIATFHFALRPEGCLLLGHSESLLHFPDLFSRADNQHKFYIRKSDRAHVSIEMIRRGFANEPSGNLALSPVFRQERPFDMELEKAAERLVLSEYGPAWVIVNEDFEIIHSCGDTGPYLQLAPGRATLALLKMAREGIRGELRKLLTKIKSEDGLVQSAVFKESDGREIRNIHLEVRRISGSTGQSGRFLVLFFTPADDRKPPPARSRTTRTRSESKADSVEVERLKQDLLLTSQRMQSLIDERDSANQDLTSANEEIQSSNEELQSINEELETSKEELQSSNEELNTLNEELQNRNRELSRLSDDLTNLLSSTTIPILMLDHELRIRRVTAAAEQLFNIRSGDISRPIGDIRMRLNVDDLELPVRRVMETLNAEELELQDIEGRWHLLRIRPYRTADNRIEGSVLTLEDITAHKQAEHILIHEQKQLKRRLESGATALHESETALLQSRNELRALTAKLLQTQAEERQRVSRELHDDLSQKLAKLQFDAERIEQQLPPDLKEIKQRLLIHRDEVEMLSNDIRRIAYELHPSALDHLGLTIALRSYIQEFTKREKIPVQFTPRKVPDKISAELISAFFRIAQESLHNVAKHAGKTSVKIALTGGPNRLSLSVQDNGIGFDAHSVQNKGRLGLVGMQERARLVNGTFSIDTRPGRGTTITVQAPLNLEGV
jgi:two-component system CheB/CheR fusion protein